MVFLIPYSCEEYKLFVDCDNCYASIPDKYNIEIQVTLNDENQYVQITLYHGTIDNGKIISIDTIYNTPYYTEMLDYNEYYSAVARYSQKGRVIFAVDGQELKNKLNKSTCEEPCYTIQGDVLDLRLK